jgi:hypothetical protein
MVWSKARYAKPETMINQSALPHQKIIRFIKISCTDVTYLHEFLFWIQRVASIFVVGGSGTLQGAYHLYVFYIPPGGRGGKV